MKSTSLTDWIQIAATLGVLAGLAVVIVEIRQTKDLAYAQNISQSYTEEFENLRIVLGESAASALSKACFEPSSLSNDDLIVLDSYYEALLLRGERASVVEGVADFGNSIQDRLMESMGRVGISEVGRTWLKLQSETWEFNTEMVEEYIQSNPVPECDSFFPQFKERLQL